MTLKLALLTLLLGFGLQTIAQDRSEDEKAQETVQKIMDTLEATKKLIKNHGIKMIVASNLVSSIWLLKHYPADQLPEFAQFAKIFSPGIIISWARLMGVGTENNDNQSFKDGIIEGLKITGSWLYIVPLMPYLSTYMAAGK